MFLCARLGEHGAGGVLERFLMCSMLATLCTPGLAKPHSSPEEGQGIGGNVGGGKGFGSSGGAKKNQQSGFSRAKEENPENFPQMQAGWIRSPAKRGKEERGETRACAGDFCCCISRLLQYPTASRD
jgi:hypothetical protein